METIEARTSAEETLRLLGRRIDTVRARIEADIIHPLRGEIAVWHLLLDEMQVQARLGAMESRDRVDALVNSLRLRIEDMKSAFEDLGTRRADQGMREELESQLAGLRAEIDAAPEFRWGSHRTAADDAAGAP